jgi:hypothetical protein
MPSKFAEIVPLAAIGVGAALAMSLIGAVVNALAL